MDVKLFCQTLEDGRYLYITNPINKSLIAVFLTEPHLRMVEEHATVLSDFYSSGAW